jgi:hypothetical protein
LKGDKINLTFSLFTALMANFANDLILKKINLTSWAIFFCLAILTAYDHDYYNDLSMSMQANKSTMLSLRTAVSRGAAVVFTLEEAIDKVISLAEAGWSVPKDLLVISHGGPFDGLEMVGVALKKILGVCGFFDASRADRLPTERAIRGQVEAVKNLDIAG